MHKAYTIIFKWACVLALFNKTTFSFANYIFFFCICQLQLLLLLLLSWNTQSCDGQSQDLEAAFAAVLTAVLQMHDRTAHLVQTQATPQKLKLDSPKIFSGFDPDQ